MKKIISGIIALTMLFSLCACGGGTEVAEENSSEEVTNSTTISGVVSSIKGNEITITSDDGSKITFQVNDDTIYSYDMEDMMHEGFDSSAKPPELSENQGNGDDGEKTPPDGNEMRPMPSDDGEKAENPPEFPQHEVGEDAPEKPDDMPPMGDRPEGDEMQTPPDEDEMQAPPNADGIESGLDAIVLGTSVTVSLSDDNVALEVKISFKQNSDNGPTG